jgi:hypothetical protein
MGSMLLNIGCTTAAWALSACTAAAAAQSERAAFIKFKGGMMPKIGQKIAVVGILSEGKQGFWFAFNNGGAYGYAAKESGVAKENDLHSHSRRGLTVKVTGTLRYKLPLRRVSIGDSSPAHPPRSPRFWGRVDPANWRFCPRSFRRRGIRSVHHPKLTAGQKLLIRRGPWDSLDVIPLTLRNQRIRRETPQLLGSVLSR